MQLNITFNYDLVLVVDLRLLFAVAVKLFSVRELFKIGYFSVKFLNLATEISYGKFYFNSPSLKIFYRSSFSIFTLFGTVKSCGI